ncbi:putative Leucine-rich melanocyte differentiation-associated protein [Blattamonas nauphoetae]|uniref:Leucine-rich melanocyte differentiation-associated protein n=1 Tax=Blattamonas nauphoetae TaxID=2049346 RepID=A0ABQ9XY43_9EUKA|nr:putative Leucine-rich melanocyte differentiation-associated protein [Blattamonas nauphoetae]
MDNYLSLAYQNLEFIGGGYVQTYGRSLKHLDLSYNKLTDKSLGPIAGFQRLESLILDGNLLTSFVSFPYLPNLHTLSVNKNKIANLSLFIEKLRTNVPNLRFLSMLNNEACPNYFFHRSPQEYQDYRFFVISRLPNLSILDTTPVTEEERLQAQTLYGYQPINHSTNQRQGAQQPTNETHVTQPTPQHPSAGFAQSTSGVDREWTQSG